MEFKDYLIGFMLTGLVMLAMFTFATNMATNNGLSESVVTGSTVNTSGLNSTLTGINSDVDTFKTSFESEDTGLIQATVFFQALFGIVTKAITGSINIFKVILDTIFTIFRLDSQFMGLVFGTILAILIITLVFAGWRVMKAG